MNEDIIFVSVYLLFGLAVSNLFFWSHGVWRDNVDRVVDGLEMLVAWLALTVAWPITVWLGFLSTRDYFESERDRKVVENVKARNAQESCPGNSES